MLGSQPQRFWLVIERGFYNSSCDSNVLCGLRAIRCEAPHTRSWKALAHLPWECDPLRTTTWASLRAASKPPHQRQAHFWGEDLSAFSHASCLMGDPVGSSAFRNRLCRTVMQEKRCGCKIIEMKWKTWSPQSKWEVLVLQNNRLVLHFALQNKACVSYPCPLKRFDVMGNSGTASTRSTHTVVSKPHF